MSYVTLTATHAQSKKTKWSFDWDTYDSVNNLKQDQVIHTVQDGDELWLLSLEYYGSKHQWKKIVDANPELQKSRKLKIGQKILIPFGDYPKQNPSVKKVETAQTQSSENKTPTAATNKKVAKGKIIFRTKEGREIIIPADNEQFELIKTSMNKGNILYQSKEGIKFPLEYSGSVRSPASEKKNGKFDEYYEMQAPVGKGKITFISSNGDHVQFNVDDQGEQEAVIRETLKQGRVLYLSSNNKKYEYNFKEGGFGREIASVPTKQKDYTYLKENFEELKEEYLKVKERNVRLEEQMVVNKERGLKLKDWANEKRLFSEEIDKLKSELAKTRDQAQKMSSAPSYHLPSMLAYNDEQVMREKTAILNKKIWVYKNKDFNKCELHFPPTEAKKEKLFKEFVLYLNETFGTDKVFGDATDGKVIFELPGRAVFGIEKPELSPKYFEIMAKISNYLEHLPVENIHISGMSKVKRVQNDKGQYIDGDVFTLKQTIALQDHFVTEMGWKPQSVTAGTMGYIESKKDQEKRFDITVKFEQKKEAGRSPASVIASTDILRNISDEIYQRLNEPKYGKVMLSEEGLELHMARKYFFKEDGIELTDDGKKKLAVIMNMFSLVNDAKFQIYWIPGMLEKDEKKNEENALIGTHQLKNHLEENFGWSKERIEVTYAKRQRNLVDSYDYIDDTYNKRIVFKLVPLSINVRQLGDLN